MLCREHGNKSVLCVTFSSQTIKYQNITWTLRIRVFWFSEKHFRGGVSKSEPIFQCFALPDKKRSWAVSWCQKLPFCIFPGYVLKKQSEKTFEHHKDIGTGGVNRNQTNHQETNTQRLTFHLQGVDFGYVVVGDEAFSLGWKGSRFPPFSMPEIKYRSMIDFL